MVWKNYRGRELPERDELLKVLQGHTNESAGDQEVKTTDHWGTFGFSSVRKNPLLTDYEWRSAPENMKKSELKIVSSKAGWVISISAKHDEIPAELEDRYVYASAEQIDDNV